MSSSCNQKNGEGAEQQLAQEKIKNLLRSNEILGAQLQEANEKLRIIEHKLCVTGDHVPFETKFAIKCVEALPLFIRRGIRRIVAFGYAFSRGS